METRLNGSYSLSQFEESDVISVLKNSMSTVVFFNCLLFPVAEFIRTCSKFNNEKTRQLPLLHVGYFCSHWQHDISF